MNDRPEPIKALGLISGGLDSTLAGFEIDLRPRADAITRPPAPELDRAVERRALVDHADEPR